MGPLAYYLLWLVAGLLVVALLSAGLTDRLRRHEQRGCQALQLLDALSRYAVWAAAQHRNPAFELQRAVPDAALREAQSVQAQAFPELQAPLADLLTADRRLHDFLRDQQQWRQSDPEAWLDSDQAFQHEQLWHSHQAALAALTLRLQEETGDPPAPVEHGPV